MILHNQLQQILRFAQKDNGIKCLGGTDGGEAAISALLHARKNLFLSEAKNLLFSKS